MNLKEIIEKFTKNNKNYQYLIVLVLVGVVIVIVASVFKGTNENAMAIDTKSKSIPIAQTNEVLDYESEMKNQLRNILAQIDGVGRVEVMLTFESGEEEVPAVNITDASSSNESNTNGEKTSAAQVNNSSSVVITNQSDGSTKPLIVKTYKPKVCGICVVAEGAENSITELRITKAVMDLLNITQSKVNVYPMKK